VNLSARARYAVMAMADLACRGPGGPVTLAQIAASQQLSQCYLEQLFGGLRRAGLVISTRGPGGGYRLARPAKSVAIADIIGAIDEPICACEAIEIDGLRREASKHVACAIHDLWSELANQINLFFAGVTLADVVEGQVLGRAMAPSRVPEAAQ
jgi:Rrf2 family transcriptional regulator, iron-sulfur cluster assembly transcription factor